MLTGTSGSKQVHRTAMMRWRRSSICSQVSGSAEGGAAGTLTACPTSAGGVAGAGSVCCGFKRAVSNCCNCVIGSLLFGRNRFVLAVQGRVQRVPRQRGALHAHGKLAHTGEHRQLAELFVVGRGILASHQVLEVTEDRLGLGQRLALEAL